jgi:hypothetical protein
MALECTWKSLRSSPTLNVKRSDWISLDSDQPSIFKYMYMAYSENDHCVVGSVMFSYEFPLVIYEVLTIFLTCIS